MGTVLAKSIAGCLAWFRTACAGSAEGSARLCGTLWASVQRRPSSPVRRWICVEVRFFLSRPCNLGMASVQACGPINKEFRPGVDAQRLTIWVFAGGWGSVGFKAGVAVTACPFARRAVFSPTAVSGQRGGRALPQEVGERAEKEGEEEDGQLKSSFASRDLAFRRPVRPSFS